MMRRKCLSSQQPLAAAYDAAEVIQQPAASIQQPIRGGRCSDWLLAAGYWLLYHFQRTA